MIKALRITLDGNIPYENVIIYDVHEMGKLPYVNFFEDFGLVFTCKDGTFTMPDYSIRLIHLRRGKVKVPEGSHRVKRILLGDDLNYQDCYIIDKGQYENCGIPLIFNDFEQLAFVNKEGLFITADFQVVKIKL